jgi:RNA polymerase sigma-70 factor (ECF subfamily)
MMAVMTLVPATAPAAARNELDELTLARARKGEDRACRVLVERYQRPVFALLSRLLHATVHAGQVEDLAQESFLRVFRALPGFRSDGAARLSTWILTIASNLAVDTLRRRRGTTVDLQEASHLHAVERSDHSAVKHAVGASLQAAVAALPEEQRVLFLLRAYHDVSHEELAASFGLELGTVKSRLSRARAALRDVLTQQEVLP